MSNLAIDEKSGAEVIPTLVGDYIKSNQIFIQAENGMLGVGPKAAEEAIDRRLINAGRDPVWFGVLFMTQVQMDYLTPPFGFTLFYMKGVAPPEVSMGDIYRSILPFVLIQFAVVVLILLSPKVVMWLPNLLFG